MAADDAIDVNINDFKKFVITGETVNEISTMCCKLCYVSY